MLIDTHAHLNAPEFSEDLPAVLDRGATVGVGQVICVGYDIPTSRRALELAERDPRVSATVGIHPNCVADAPDGWQKTIERLALHPRVVAIGETGLDYYRGLSPRNAQAHALEWHCRLADEVGLPLILHNRNSDSDLTVALLRWTSTRRSVAAPGVLHSFSGTASMLDACVEAGFAVSFSGMVTFPNKSLAYLGNLVQQTPEETLLVETDAPYMAPVPFRGRRNEPALVRTVAERIAWLRRTSIEEIERLTTGNARRVFPGLGTGDLA